MTRRRKRKATDMDATVDDLRRMEDRERRGLQSSTPERLARSGARLDVGQGPLRDERGNPVEVQRVQDWPLARLSARGLLGTGEVGKTRYEAAVRFYGHGYLGGILAGPRAVSFDMPAGGFGPRDGLPASERAAWHREAFRRAQVALGRDRIATVTALVVLDEVSATAAAAAVTTRGRAEQLQAIGVEYLCDGLDRLAAHFAGRR